jgi:hypothetical protein
MHRTWARLVALLVVMLALPLGAHAQPAAPPNNSIELLMLNQRGEPAVGANVDLFLGGQGNPVGWGTTDQNGRASIRARAGSYSLMVSSSDDHFVVFREEVISPSSLALDTSDTVGVTVAVRDKAGRPMGFSHVSFEPFRGDGDMGMPDGYGKLHVDLTPGTYCGSAQRLLIPPTFYYLEHRGIEIDGPTTVVFDASAKETGRMVMHPHPRSTGWAGGYISSPCRNWAILLGLLEREEVIISPGDYELGDLAFSIKDAEGDRWDYRFWPLRLNIPPGGVADVWVGEHYTATILPPASAAYAPGEGAPILAELTDEHERRLRKIRAPAGETRAHVSVWGPEGNLLQEGSCSHWASHWATDCGYDIPSDAPEGVYDAQWSLDTGPLQGVVTATSQFTVSLPPRLYLPLILQGIAPGGA